jgi:hypothetical protein
MSYYITEQKANFVCDCGYEKHGITIKAGKTIERIHSKVCPNQKIKIRLTEKPEGFGAAKLPTMLEFRADRYGRDYRNELRCAMEYVREELKK